MMRHSNDASPCQRLSRKKSNRPSATQKTIRSDSYRKEEQPEGSRPEIGAPKRMGLRESDLSEGSDSAQCSGCSGRCEWHRVVEERSKVAAGYNSVVV
jgi:hypothetical protein